MNLNFQYYLEVAYLHMVSNVTSYSHNSSEDIVALSVNHIRDSLHIA